jgi:hypothetical protein
MSISYINIDAGLLRKIREGESVFANNPDWILQKRDGNILLVLWEWNNTARLYISISRVGFSVRSYDGIHCACGALLPPLLASIAPDFERRYPMKRDPSVLFPQTAEDVEASKKLKRSRRIASV